MINEFEKKIDDESHQQLVVFSYSSPFHDKLTSNERYFTISNKLLKISQKYQSDGKGGTSIGFGASVYDCSFILAYYLEIYPNEVRFIC